MAQWQMVFVGIDVLLVVLLAAVLVYAVVLNKRLRALRAWQAELEALAAQFARNTDQASVAIAQLRDGAAESRKSMSALLEQAAASKQELQFLTSKADQTAEKLVKAVDAARPATTTALSMALPLNDSGKTARRSKAETELLAAMKQGAK